MSYILYKNKFTLNKLFLLWIPTHALQFGLIGLFLSQIISNSFLYLAIFGLIINITTGLIKHFIFYKIHLSWVKIIIILIFLVLIILFFNPIIQNSRNNYSDFSFESFNNLRLDSLNYLEQQTSQISSEEESLTEKCHKNLDRCISISKEKWGILITIIEMRNFTDIPLARDYFNTWKGLGFSQSSLDITLGVPYNKQLKDFFPVVLSPSKIEVNGQRLPLILVCDNNGTIAELTKLDLAC